MQTPADNNAEHQAGDRIPCRAQPSPHDPQPLRGTRILVADDVATNRKLIRVALQRAEAEVTTADNGKAAVELATSQPFDLILMDMQMPVMDGYIATRELRARGLTIPILALTAHAMGGDENKCLQYGCSGYLPKPINLDLLVLEVAGALAQPARSSIPTRTPRTAPPKLVSTLPLEKPPFRKIVRDFVQDLDRQLLTAHKFWNDRNLADLGDLAHQLKGTSGLVGFVELMNAFRLLEQLIEQGNQEPIESALRSIEELRSRISIPEPEPGDSGAAI